jgi:hypothetical protein
MNVLRISLLLLISLTVVSQTKKTRIKLVQYLPYCGGANTTKDFKNTPNKSVVYSNKKLIVISDEHIDTVITDKSGYLKTTWGYGTYLLFEPWKYYKQIPKGYSEQNLDMNCLKQEWLKEDLKIVVSKKATTVANNIILLKCPNEFVCLTDKRSQK